MKILLLSTSSQSGGGPQVVHDLAKGLRQASVVVDIGLPADGPYYIALQEQGFPLHPLQLDRLHPATLLKLIRLLKSHNYDLIHSHGKGAGLYARLAHLLTGCPVVHTHHGLHLSQMGRLSRQLYVWYERFLSRLTARVINVSQTQQAQGLRYRLFKPNQSTVIYNSTTKLFNQPSSQDIQQLRQQLGIAPQDLVLIMVARFDPVKNHLWLVQAFAQLVAQHPTVKLLLVGQGELFNQVQQRVIELRLQSAVILAGQRQDIPQLMAASDIFVLASDNEGMPLTLIEAMMAQLPLLGSDVVGINELIIPEHNGLLFKCKDDQSFLRQASQLIQSPQYRQQLGQNGQQQAQTTYSYATFVSQHISVYTEVIKQQKT